MSGYVDIKDKAEEFSFFFFQLPLISFMLRYYVALTTPGLNFINVLHTTFRHKDPRSVKKTAKLSIFFTLSGSMSVKAVPKMLDKLTPDKGLEKRPGFNPINNFFKTGK
jgi:hypothetical protein